jgi:hypothetical protein
MFNLNYFQVLCRRRLGSLSIEEIIDIILMRFMFLINIKVLNLSIKMI